VFGAVVCGFAAFLAVAYSARCRPIIARAVAFGSKVGSKDLRRRFLFSNVIWFTRATVQRGLCSISAPRSSAAPISAPPT
jgi:hypothetical protein